MAGSKQNIVIVGTGFAGYHLAQTLDQRRYDLTVISPHSTSPYTPLLASAACGLFDFRLAEEPIRRKSRSDTRYFQASVLSVDFSSRQLNCVPAFDKLRQETFTLSYDILILAPGCRTNTFDTPGVSEHAFFLKNVRDATAVRNRLSDMLEIAALPTSTAEQQNSLLHVAIVGGGPTGIEMAAELSDLFDGDLAKLYPDIAGKWSIAVHDVAPQILAPYERSLSQYATTSLKDHRIEIKVDSHVTRVTADYIETQEDGRIPYGMLIWATGNRSVELVDSLPVSKPNHGLRRILTDKYLRVRHQDGTVLQNVYALGDAADVEQDTLPTTAEVAVQKAEYLARALNAVGQPSKPFQYRQKAMITYTGDKDGVVQGKSEYTGYAAWLGWRIGNLGWTTSWRRKVMICMQWVWDWIDGREIARN